MGYLTKAVEVVNGDRQKDYGDIKGNFERIAAHWSQILGKDVSVEEFTLCMIAVKMARLKETPKHEDSWTDIVGYVACIDKIHK